MASGRTGGTKAKITGQVGSTIYQIRKNLDGTYTQVTISKGERTETQTSPRLQAQRMCTAMVESMMADLKEVARISMQSAPNKSKSLNAFSANNLRIVAQDCKTNWYANNQFNYPWWDRTKTKTQDMGGPYLISAGTLNFNVFNSMVYDDYPTVNWIAPSGRMLRMYGVQFNLTLGVTTIGDFLKAHHMTRLDYFVFTGFDHYTDWDANTGDPIETFRHIYCIAQLNPKFQESQVINSACLVEMFLMNSNADFTVYAKRDGSAICLGYMAEYEDLDEQLYYDAAFTISYLDGRKKISSSSYKSPDGGTNPWLTNAQPAMVFGSWMQEPSVRPYPSPFE